MTAVASLSVLHLLLTSSMKWKLTPTLTECRIKDINNTVKVWTEAVDDGMKRISDRRTCGWRERKEWPAKFSCQLIKASVKSKEAAPCYKYQNKLMWKRWKGFWKKCAAKEARKKGRFSDECSPLYSAWLVGTGRWLFQLYLVEQVLGPKPFWIDLSEKVSHTGLNSNVFSKEHRCLCSGAKERLFFIPGRWRNYYWDRISWLSCLSVCQSVCSHLVPGAALDNSLR